jgi:hypothetical protein
MDDPTSQMLAAAPSVRTFHVLADEHGVAARMQAGAVELHDVAVVVQALQDAHLLQNRTAAQRYTSLLKLLTAEQSAWQSPDRLSANIMGYSSLSSPGTLLPATCSWLCQSACRL